MDRRIIRTIDWEEVKEYIKNTPSTSTIYVGVDEGDAFLYAIGGK